MATRMQQRRGTAAQWTAANPVLAAGEIGFETDTSKFKMGNGSSAWSALTYFANAAELSAIIDGAPEALNTLNELAAALGDDPAFFTNLSESIADNIDAHNVALDVHGIANTALLATLTDVSTAQTDAQTFATTAVTNHSNDTNGVHGIEDTAALAKTAEVTTAIGNAVTGHSSDTEGIHGISDTANLLYTSDLSTHNLDTTLVHGIEDTAELATKTYADTAVSTHQAETLEVHGIANTALLATQDYVDTAITNSTVELSPAAGIGIDWNSETDQYDIDSTVATTTYVGTEIGTHNSSTTSVHGIADTEELETQTGAQNKADLAQGAAENYTDTAIGALTKTSVGLGNVDNTSDSSKPVSTATQTALDNKLGLVGGTLTGALTLHADPSSSLHAATKQYVDNTASGVVAKPQVLGATAANINATYSNGTAGVGATLTHNTNGEFPADAGGASGWAVGKGILVKNQTNKAQNGRYFISNMGSVSTPYVLTRCGYCDEASEIPGAYIFVQDGTSAGTGWIQVVADPATFVVGTDNIDVFQFSGSGTITAGTNISVSGNEISVVATPSLSGVAFTDGTQTLEGVPSRTPIIQKTASYTLSALTERDDLIEMGSSSALTLTIPTDATLNFPIGTSIDILQASTGQVTIAGAGGVTVNATPGLKLRTTWSSCTLFKRAANTWVVYGDLTA